jgi:lysine 6-dehydrogenase
VKVAVLGAGGTIAPAIVRDLAESEEAERLLLLDLDGQRAAAVAEKHGAGKAESREVDARNGLAGELAGTDVLVNSASYRINLDAMRACLEAGCHYVDLGGLYHVTQKQLGLHGEFEQAGLLALLGMGSSPGKTNVMGAQAVAKLGHTPERIDVTAAGRDLDPPEGFSVPYALRTLIDELTMAPMAVRDGDPVELEPLTPAGEEDFPVLGHGEAIYTLHSEVLTFPTSFGCRECSFRLSLAPALLERLRELTDAPEDAIEAAARGTVPASGNTVSVHVVQADEVRATAVTQPMEEWGLGGGVVSTAAPSAAAVRLLARGKIDARGAVPPELCVNPDDLFPELERRNCTFDLEVNAPR